MAAEDVERLRAGYEAYNRGAYEEILELMAPDVEAHDRREMPAADTYEGHAGVMTAFHAVHEDFEDFRIEPEEFLDLGDRIVVVLRQSGRGRKSGLPVEGTIVHLWTVRGGKALSLRAFSTREEAIEAARD